MPNKLKQDKLRIAWSKKENAHLYGGISKHTGGLLAHFFEGIQYPEKRNLIQELEYRGYDLTTLKFEIAKKQPAESKSSPEFLKAMKDKDSKQAELDKITSVINQLGTGSV